MLLLMLMSMLMLMLMLTLALLLSTFWANYDIVDIVEMAATVRTRDPVSHFLFSRGDTSKV